MSLEYFPNVNRFSTLNDIVSDAEALHGHISALVTEGLESISHPAPWQRVLQAACDAGANQRASMRNLLAVRAALGAEYCTRADCHARSLAFRLWQAHLAAMQAFLDSPGIGDIVHAAEQRRLLRAELDLAPDTIKAA